MKKICFVCPSLHQGGLENSVMVMANEMARRGNIVSVICIYKNPVFYTLDKSIKVVFPKYDRKDYVTPIYYLKSVKYLRDEIIKMQPDKIVSYGDFLNPITILATRSLGIPVYISDRSSPGKRFPFIVQKMRERLYPLSDGIIAQTETARQQKLKMLKGYKNVKVIPNPIRPVTPYPEIPRENIVLAVGRHYHVKGLDRVISAFAQTNNKGWRLLIAGNHGPHTEELNNLVLKLGIVDKVEFLGPVKDIDKVFSKAGIFVLSSRSEGFPNALIEAMANGVASISFDIVAGPRDIISNNTNGILVENEDVTELADKINYLIEYPAERNRMSAEAIKIKDTLSVEKIGDMFYNFINIK